jgi:hypothetical protein
MDIILANAQRSLDAAFQSAKAQLDQVGHSVAMRSGAAPHLMAQDPSAVHANSPLPNISIQYQNREMIADDVMPVFNVQKRSDVYWKYSADLMFNLADVTIGGPLGNPAQASPSQTTATYTCQERVLRDYVPQSTIDNADSPLNPLVDSTEYLNSILRLAREKRVADIVFLAGSYGANTSALSGGTRWDTSTGVPISDIMTAMSAMTMAPTIAVIGEQAFMKFINNAEVKGFFTSRAGSALGATPFFMDAETLGRALMLKKFLVGRAKYNSANDGQAASIVGNFIWGKGLALLHVPQSLGVRTASFGITFRWVGARNVGGSTVGGPFVTRSWFEPNLGAWGAHAVQVAHADTEVNIDATGATGYYYSTVIS